MSGEIDYATIYADEIIKQHKLIKQLQSQLAEARSDAMRDAASKFQSMNYDYPACGVSIEYVEKWLSDYADNLDLPSPPKEIEK